MTFMTTRARMATQLHSSLVHLRVVARHERARSDCDEQTLILADGGVVTVEDVTRLMEDRVGRLTRVRFDQSTASRTRVSWSGRDVGGTIVRGHVALHAGLSAGGIVVWAKVVLDRERDARDDQLAEVAYAGRALIRRLRETPTTPVGLIVGEIVRIVDAAERGMDQ